MIREILFRGKALYKHGIVEADEHGWVYGVPVPIKINSYETDRVEIVAYHDYEEFDGYDLLAEDSEVNPETIGQWTGLVDKNGKKIFEGDIVNLHGHGCSFKAIEKVRYFKGGFSPYAYPGLECTPDPEETEVIGNIYDNPELLEH